MKKESKIKQLVCSKGHDISVVGRTKSRNCKQCQSDYYKERREFVKKYFPKPS